MLLKHPKLPAGSLTFVRLLARNSPPLVRVQRAIRAGGRPRWPSVRAVCNSMPWSCRAGANGQRRRTGPFGRNHPRPVARRGIVGSVQIGDASGSGHVVGHDVFMAIFDPHVMRQCTPHAMHDHTASCTTSPSIAFN